jgi:Rrf2 family protein
LSRAFGGPPVLIADMAERESIPKRFLEQILLQLKSEGLVDSKKGKGGGYVLTRAPARITVGEVIRMIEGPLAPLPCASVTGYRRCDECVDDRLCGTRLVMREVRDAMAGILDGTTLADVLARVDKLCAEDREATPAELMYYI